MGYIRSVFSFALFVASAVIAVVAEIAAAVHSAMKWLGRRSFIKTPLLWISANGRPASPDDSRYD